MNSQTHSLYQQEFLKVESRLKQAIQGTPFEGQVYLVGGACRDFINNEESWDWDLVVEIDGGAEKLARHLAEKFPDDLSQPHPLGQSYPIWQLARKNSCDESRLPGNIVLEIADSQAEMFPDPTTRARRTVWGPIDVDCKRRDLTINMLYKNLSTGEWRDPSGTAIDDIQHRRIRGYPGLDLKKIFSDDPLRILRLVRFQCYWDSERDEHTWAEARSQVKRLGILSAERIRDEWEKLLKRGILYRALEMYRELGVLEELFPEFVPMIGCAQDKIYHSEGDVWVHTLGVIKNCGRSRILQLTGLLHDVGKPATQTFVGPRIKFIDHEKKSVEIAENFLTRMKYGAEDKARILRLVALHLRGGDVSRWTTLKPARKLLRDAGDLIEELIVFIEADSKFSWRENGQPDLSHIPLLRERILEAQKIPPRLKPLVSGDELMSLSGRAPGSWIKDIQSALRDFEDDFVSEHRRSPNEAEIKKQILILLQIQ